MGTSFETPVGGLIIHLIYDVLICLFFPFCCKYGIIFAAKQYRRQQKGVKMARKRSNGEGSIHRLPSGSWQVQVMVGYHPDGKRKFKTFTAPTQQAAKKLKLEFDQMRAAGIQTEKDYTFMEWAQIWFEHHKKNVSATTQEGYKYTLRILINHFGHRKLDSIKAFDIEEFLMEKKMEKASSSQLTKLKGMLVQIFDRAAANDLILRNPAAHLEKMKKEHKTPAEAFTK